MFYLRPQDETTSTDLGEASGPAPVALAALRLADETYDWRLDAACRGLDPLVFHPSEGDEGLEAKAVCAECPVRQDCLDHALAVREKDGVWGGLTAIERRRLLRRMRRSA